MKVLFDEQGYVTSFAIEGELVDGLELPDPEDIDHFTEHFGSYLVRDGNVQFDDTDM